MAGQNPTISPEVFKPIPDFPGYEVSDQGKVRSFWRQVSKGKGGGTYWELDSQPQRILKPWFHNGYPWITLVNNGKHSTVTIHQLVLETFVGPCPPGEECRHLNGIHAHSYLTNLAWGTHSENVKDTFRHGKTHQGMDHPQNRLTDDQVLKIRELFAQGGYSKAKLGRMFNVTQENIGHIVRRKRWTHLH